jgi:methyl-accepting chemotaxis protein-1 (serine sensor receptor)
MTLKSRMTSVIGFLLLLAVSVGSLGLYGMSDSNDALKSVYVDRTVPLERLAFIERSMVRNRLMLAEGLLDPAEANVRVLSDEMTKSIADMEKAWVAFNASQM